MKLSERISAAMRDVLLPALSAIRNDLKELRRDVWLGHAALRKLVVAEFERLDRRIEGRDDQRWRRTPCARSRRGCRLRRQ